MLTIFKTMFKILQSPLLGNILLPIYCTAFKKTQSGSKVPGSFPNIFPLKLCIIEIY